MDNNMSRLAAYIADLGTPETLEDAIRERNHWVETACHFSKGEEYYRGLLDEIAAHIGPEARRATNGDEMHSVVRARLPQLVAESLATKANPMTPEPAQPAEAWLNDPASLESGEPAQPAESSEARAIVPVVPTEAMYEAAAQAWKGTLNTYWAREMWDAMLAASPPVTTFAASTARPTERDYPQDFWEATTEDEREALFATLHGLKCNPSIDEIPLVMTEVVAILRKARPTERGAVEASDIAEIHEIVTAWRSSIGNPATWLPRLRAAFQNGGE